MNQLPEHITDQINKEADKYGFRVPYDGSTNYYNEDRVKGYQDGANVHAIKWQVSDEMMNKMAIALRALNEKIDELWNEVNGLNLIPENHHAFIINAQRESYKLLTEYNNYKQTNNVTE